MICYFRFIAAIFFVLLFGAPLVFYNYERIKKHSLKWCFHKTMMLFGALLICAGLAWPLISNIAMLVCRAIR
jgi:hypothetical protein